MSEDALHLRICLSFRAANGATAQINVGLTLPIFDSGILSQSDIAKPSNRLPSPATTKRLKAARRAAASQVQNTCGNGKREASGAN